MNKDILNGLFKPFILNNEIFDMLEVVGMSKKDFLRLNIEDECSKSKENLCINTECPFNLLELHEDEVYIEIQKAINGG